MSQTRIEELKEQSRAALARSMGQVRAAALMAALVPLASVAVAPAMAESGGTGGTGSGGYSVPSPCDFVTSGGFVLRDDGGKVTFGAHGGCKNGEFKGSMTVSDHALDYHLDLQQMTGYLAPGTNSVVREICGLARTSRGETVAFRLRLDDNDEPGISDQFGLVVSNGYHVPTRLLGNGGPGGGNVQLHKPNRTNVGPAAPGTEAQMCFGLPTP